MIARVTRPAPQVQDLLVGLEIHQQLATPTKLFCHCPPAEDPTVSYELLRRLRPTQSELGQVDPAALFEFQRGRWMRYQASSRVTCLVEADEEPPHPISREAVEAAVLISLALGASVVDEVHVMRKIVIDGSNTTGFQRTVVVGHGGQLQMANSTVPVQTITLEEDAARLGDDKPDERRFRLDRLGVPLVEVALAPVSGGPEHVERVALELGRLLRATRRVARGLGTIRQDLNVSYRGGSVVEVKGVQKLEILRKVVAFELARQHHLSWAAEVLRDQGVTDRSIAGSPQDVTDLLRGTACKTISRVVMAGGAVHAMGLRGMHGLIGLEPEPGIRVGRELADFVRFYGLGGLFHGDELPGYGISHVEVDAVRSALKLADTDSFLLLAGTSDILHGCWPPLLERLAWLPRGVPAETRGPTETGETRFLRPRPGAARMYPETDIPPTPVLPELLQRLGRQLPRAWHEQVAEYQARYELSEKLALQIYDSDHAELFEEIVREVQVSPTLVAITLTETLVQLSRERLAVERIGRKELRELFDFIGKGSAAKEAVPDILALLARGEVPDVAAAIQRLGVTPVADAELAALIDRIVGENRHLMIDRGEQAFQPLMGLVMKAIRGRADGGKVSALLRERLRREGERPQPTSR